jgi:hypothetical protein
MSFEFLESLLQPQEPNVEASTSTTTSDTSVVVSSDNIPERPSLPKTSAKEIYEKMFPDVASSFAGKWEMVSKSKTDERVKTARKSYNEMIKLATAEGLEWDNKYGHLVPPKPTTTAVKRKATPNTKTTQIAKKLLAFVDRDLEELAKKKLELTQIIESFSSNDKPSSSSLS